MVSFGKKEKTWSQKNIQVIFLKPPYFFRYLSTGMTFSALAYEFYRGVSTISEIVEVMADCIWDTLHQDYMSMPTTEEWVTIAERFYQQWNIPNCVGSIDGKHVRIKCPNNSGSAYYNYQGFFSIVLLGCVDADSLFTWISVGDYGRNSDGRVINSAGVITALENNEISLPNPQPLPNTVAPPFPYFFIGDQGFPLKTNLFRPYPKKTSDDRKRVFNYRLSRARKTVECAFGILAHKFRLFLSQIECNPEKATKIVKAACILHNFIKMHDGVAATPSYENEILTAYNNWTPLPRTAPQGQRNQAKALRDLLCEYFTKPENALPHQNIYN